MTLRIRSRPADSPEQPPPQAPSPSVQLGAQPVGFLAGDPLSQQRKFGLLLGLVDPLAQLLELRREHCAGFVSCSTRALGIDGLAVPALYHFERRSLGSLSHAGQNSDISVTAG